jgi:hypothetical protein
MTDILIKIIGITVIIAGFYIGFKSIVKDIMKNKIVFLPKGMVIYDRDYIYSKDKKQISKKIMLPYDNIKSWQIDATRVGGAYGEAVKEKYGRYPLKHENVLRIFIKTNDGKHMDFTYSKNKNKNLKKYVGQKEIKPDKFIQTIMRVRNILKILSIIIILILIYTMIANNQLNF